MKDKLRNYIESIFEDAPKTKKIIELKEEVLQNLIDKYDDLITEGKSEEAAYNLAIASLGDISSLIDEIIKESHRMPAYSQEVIEKNKRKSALLVSIAIGLYIVSVIPCLIFRNNIGPILLFVIAAIATALLIYNSKTKIEYTKMDDTMVEEFKEWKEKNSEKNKVFQAISNALWALTVVIYIVVSFVTSAWHITWIIFLIAAAINSVIKAVFEIRK